MKKYCQLIHSTCRRYMYIKIFRNSSSGLRISFNYIKISFCMMSYIPHFIHDAIDYDLAKKVVVGD